MLEVWRSPVSAPALGAGGRRFESCHLDHKNKDHSGNRVTFLFFRSYFSGPVAQLDRAAAF